MSCDFQSPFFHEFNHSEPLLIDCCVLNIQEVLLYCMIVWGIGNGNGARADPKHCLQQKKLKVANNMNSISI